MWTSLGSRNNQQWFLPSLDTSRSVFVFSVNSGSKVACWAFEEQLRHLVKTTSLLHAALIPVALVFAIPEHSTTSATCDAQMLLPSLEKSLLLLYRQQCFACCTDITIPSGPISAWTPHTACITHTLAFCVNTTSQQNCFCDASGKDTQITGLELLHSSWWSLQMKKKKKKSSIRSPKVSWWSGFPSCKSRIQRPDDVTAASVDDQAMFIIINKTLSAWKLKYKTSNHLPHLIVSSQLGNFSCC